MSTQTDFMKDKFEFAVHRGAFLQRVKYFSSEFYTFNPVA